MSAPYAPHARGAAAAPLRAARRRVAQRMRRVILADATTMTPDFETPDIYYFLLRLLRRFIYATFRTF